ncbi:MAG: hypothetical protein ACXVUL_01520 [Solirubrobacteraceae bacterium]
MKDRVSKDQARSAPEQRLAPVRPLGAQARGGGPTPAEALFLQRAAGNRATARKLARWAKHPDADKKGVLLPDVVAAEYLRFNPPKNQ